MSVVEFHGKQKGEYMITYPLHPQDAEMLMDIRRYLIGYRITNSWTQEELGLKMSGVKGTIYPLENDMNFQWRFSRLQQWPVPFGLRLDAQLVFDDSDYDECRLEEFIGRDQFVRVFGELAHTDPKWQRSYLIASLRAARQGRGWDQGVLAQHLGVTPGAISRWEQEADQVMLTKLLAHARGLKGRLELKVTK